MNLPSSCEGCPFYKYRDAPGNGFVPDVVVPGSTLFILAQNPGGNEVKGHKLTKRHYVGAGAFTDEYEQVQPQPLIGTTGKDFTTRFLPLTRLQRREVSLGNAIRCRPGAALAKDAHLQGSDSLPNLTSTMKLESSKADIVNALKHCRTTHMRIPPSVKVVMTMGNYAMFAMTGITRDEDEYRRKQSALESWRGYGVKVSNFNDVKTVDTSTYHNLTNASHVVFMTMHIAGLYYGRNSRFTHAIMQDFHKVGRLLRGEWPIERMPAYNSIPPVQWPAYASFDTEYNPDDGNRLERWSMCSTDGELYCVEAHDTTSVIPVEEGSTVLIQNALADIEHLSTLVDFSKVKIEDLMLAHSVLWSDEPHSLNYLNSLYGELNRYKHLSQQEAQFYSAADAWEPMRMWRTYFIPEFKRDPQSWKVYKRYRLPLINIIDKAQRSGVKLDSERLRELECVLQERIASYAKRAQEIVPVEKFNLGGSKQMKEVLYGG